MSYDIRDYDELPEPSADHAYDRCYAASGDIDDWAGRRSTAERLADALNDFIRFAPYCGETLISFNIDLASVALQGDRIPTTAQQAIGIVAIDSEGYAVIGSEIDGFEVREVEEWKEFCKKHLIATSTEVR